MFWGLLVSGSVMATNLVENSEQTVPSETLNVCECSSGEPKALPHGASLL